MRIAVDAMGGDHAPAALVAGAVAAARELGTGILLCGDQRAIERELSSHSTKGADIEICAAADVIEMDESPTAALRRPDSSLRAAIEATRAGDTGATVYAGNTGAGMMLGVHLLRRLPGVERPAIAVLIPNGGGQTLLLDAGANVDTRPLHLAQFAVMGDAYVRAVRGVAAPRVALLSNGVEEGKGDARVRAALPLIRELPLNFVGQAEGSDLCREAIDVAVCDGFAGNLALKGIEGFGHLVGDELEKSFRRGLRGRLAYLLLRPALVGLRAAIDPRETGGALLLGLNGTIVKAHGSSDSRAVRNAIGLAGRLAERQVTAEVARGIETTIGLAERGEGEAAADAPKQGIWRSLRERLRRERKESGGERQPAVPGDGDAGESDDE